MTEVKQVRRGRPRDPEKMHQILEMGAQVFFEQGFERASMEAVAARAGVSKVTLYKYFPSKLALMETCVRDRTETSFEGFDERLYDPADPAQGLQRLGSQFLGLMRDPDVMRMMGMLYGVAAMHPEVAQRYYQAGPELVISRVTAYLERVRAHGALDIPDPRFAGEMFLGLFLGPMHTRAILGIALPTPDDDRRLVDEAVALFLARHHTDKRSA